MRKFFILSILFTLAFGSLSQAAPLSEYRWLKAGRYKVLLIDTKMGNQLQFGVFVNAGSDLDEPVRHAGRAHLFEHNFFAASVKYPGLTDWDRIADSMGSSNGWTAQNHTYYYVGVHPDDLEKAMDLFGAYFSEPLLGKEGYVRELATVKNEAAGYQNGESEAPIYLMDYYLNADGDFRKRYSVGTGAQLDGMRVEDLANFFYANYQPENLVIMIAGNLSQTNEAGAPLITDSLVKSLVREHFYFPSQESLEKRLEAEWGRPFNLTERPSMEVQRRLVRDPHFVPMGKGESRSGSRSLRIATAMEIDRMLTPKEELALDLFSGMVNSRLEGSWVDEMKKKDLVNGAGMHFQALNNVFESVLTISLVSADVDEKLVLDSYFSALHDVLSGKADPRVFEFLKKSAIPNLLKKSAVAGQISQSLVMGLNSNFARGDFDLDPYFNPEQIYGSLTLEDTLKIVGKYLNYREGFSYLDFTPKVTSGEVTIFGGRKFQRFLPSEAEEIRGIVNSALTGKGQENQTFTPRVSEKIFEPSPWKGAESARALPVEFGGMGDRLTHSYIHQSLKTKPGQIGAVLTLRLPKFNTVEEEVAFDLWFAAFVQGHTDFFASVSSGGQDLKISTPGGGILLIGYEGQANLFPTILVELFDAMKAFETQPLAFNMAKNMVGVGLKRASRFSIESANNHFKNLLLDGEPLKSQQALALDGLEFKSFKEVHEKRFSSFARGDAHLTLIGDAALEDTQKIFAQVSSEFEDRLTFEERLRWANLRKEVAGGLYWVPNDFDVSDDDNIAIGTVKAPFTAHELTSDPRRYATFMLLDEIYQKGIYSRNRDQHELGYTHSGNASFGVHPEEAPRLAAYGSATKPQAARRMLAGWNWVYEHLMAGDLFEQIGMDFENFKSGLWRTSSTEPETLLGVANEVIKLAARSNDRDFEWHSAWRKEIAHVTLSDLQMMVQEIAEANPNPVKMVMSKVQPKGSCAVYLTGK